MKKIFAMALVTLIIIGATVPAQAAAIQDFTDVKTTAWYYNAVNYATNKGLFNGTSSTKFSPNSTMTRAMFVTVLSRMSKFDASKYPGSSFADVKSTSWYAASVQWAYYNGIITGTSATKFSPDAAITREQIATILFRYKNMLDHTKNFRNSHNGNLFEFYSDHRNTSLWACEGMWWATIHGIINGDENGRLRPTSKITRAETAQILLNASSKFTDTTLLDERFPGTSPAPDTTTKPASYIVSGYIGNGGVHATYEDAYAYVDEKWSDMSWPYIGYYIFNILYADGRHALSIDWY